MDAGERRSNEKIFFNSLVAAYTGAEQQANILSILAYIHTYIQTYSIIFNHIYVIHTNIHHTYIHKTLIEPINKVYLLYLHIYIHTYIHKTVVNSISINIY